MQFIENGPDIPEELLLALDEGRVVFFCGAGVSQANARLPDFFGLANKVRTTLGDSDDSEAAEKLKVAGALENEINAPGLISADSVFSLLERDFEESDIECAVATALTPKKGVDLRAHKLLLDLATTRIASTKLVTANFDRLFEACGQELKIWQPPRLPDPARLGELDGIVYLHGRATKDYNGAEGDGFVLSSAEFGRAYLAEGWATRFFKDVIDRYVVVFVGYSADDPPVRYLLEALNKVNDREDKAYAYAFQSGNAGDAALRWGNKGVLAIPYENNDDHAALWNTLKEWAERAKDLEGWQEKIIAMARHGPEILAPFERGQVAHLVSTKEGAHKFQKSEPPAPATWLCVFDRSIRCSEPGQDENGSEVNPFALYGLAGDDAPPSISPDDNCARRETPPKAWEAFELNRRDRLELRDDYITPLRGCSSLVAGALPDRIHILGVWIAEISNQSAAVWWGARQLGLHEEIQKRIRSRLGRSGTECAPHNLQSWQYLFEHWRARRDEEPFGWLDFRDEVEEDGWGKKAIRKYEMLSRPRLKAGPNTRYAVPPQADKETGLKDLISLDLAYNEESRPDVSSIPDEWLADVVSALKRNLDIGVELATECGRYRWRRIPPIIHSEDPDISKCQRNSGLAGAVLSYAFLFERLLQLDVEMARQEVATWPTDDYNVFARLRIWASRFEAFVPNEEFDKFFGKVSREAFWQSGHQRDLLLTLQERWVKLPMSATRRIEERILEGPERSKNLSEMACAWEIADRLHWLHSKGFDLHVKYEREIKRLKKLAPYWTSEQAKSADRSLEVRGEIVRTDTEYSVLLSERLPKVLMKAQELRGRTGLEFVDHDPFAGLSTSRPVMALSALRLSAKGGGFPKWAWRSFLQSEKRKEDNIRFKNFIAELLVAAGDEALDGIAYFAAVWLHSTSEQLAENCVPVFERLVRRLLDFLSDNPNVSGTGDSEWATEALLSTAGNVVEALYYDPRCKDLVERQGLPVEWRSLVENALVLPGDSGRFALVCCSLNLNWFYHVDPEWTDEKLLSALRTKDTNTNMLVNLYFFDAKLFRIRYYKRAHELILFLDAKLFHIW